VARDVQPAIDLDARASRTSSNSLKQPFFLQVSTIRSEGVRWIVARETVNHAQPSICRIQLVIGFQLVKIWATITSKHYCINGLQALLATSTARLPGVPSRVEHRRFFSFGARGTAHDWLSPKNGLSS